jgi:hypothetical protein
VIGNATKIERLTKAINTKALSKQIGLAGCFLKVLYLNSTTSGGFHPLEVTKG